MINKNTKTRIYTSLVLLGLIFLIIKFNFILAYTLIIFGVLSIIEILRIYEKIFSNNYYKYIINVFSIIYIFTFCYFFFLFSNLLQLKIILYSLLLGCIASDIGGFVLGKILKGPKISKISPNKTYAGVFGSIFFTSFTLSILFFFFTGLFNFKILILSILTSIGCQIGDLFFSYLKRKAKIKDTGNILPGHGGILDRIDGILFGIPTGFILLIIIY
tara:strand:- start:2387 stop:3037 length:651 start_codon:yes stop_codon:yes gene_type:complete